MSRVQVIHRRLYSRSVADRAGRLRPAVFLIPGDPTPVRSASLFREAALDPAQEQWNMHYPYFALHTLEAHHD